MAEVIHTKIKVKMRNLPQPSPLPLPALQLPTSTGKGIYTITFGDVAENGIGMEQLGQVYGRGLTVSELVDAQTMFDARGFDTELIDLTEGLTDDDLTYLRGEGKPKVIKKKSALPKSMCDVEASMLIVRNGVEAFVKDVTQLRMEQIHVRPANLLYDIVQGCSPREILEPLHYNTVSRNFSVLRCYMSLILNITKEAAKQLLSLQCNGKLLKLSVSRGGCVGYKHHMEYINPNQVKQYDENVGLVIVDAGAIHKIIGSTLDYHQNDVSEGFKLVNPNIKAMCGCGESLGFGPDKDM